MNLDLGDVLSRAWEITWKHKSLWVFGIFLGLIVFAIFPFAFSPVLLPVLSEEWRTTLAPVVVLAWLGIFLLFFLAMFPVSAIMQASVTLGAFHANQGEEYSHPGELIKKSLPFFGRVLGMMFLFTAGVLLINFIIQAVSFLLTIVTFGLGALCLTPLFLLMYPAIILASVWVEQAINGIVVDDMKVMDAAKQGWELIRNNLASIGVLGLVVYFGIGILTSIMMIPMMVSLFVLPLGFLEQKINWTFISIALLSGAAFVPLFVVFNGWSLAFMKSVWVLLYLRLTRGSAQQTVLLEATS
jgi:hypothetical protein